MERDLAEAELRMNATPQTLRHRKAAVIDELFNRDKLGMEQFRAAREMAQIVAQIARGLHARTSSFNQRVDMSQRSDDWQPGLSRAYQERYIPWRDEAGRTALRDKATLADLTLDLVVSNLGVRQTAALWGMDQRTVLEHLRVSLWRYAEIAGWVRVTGDAE